MNCYWRLYGHNTRWLSALLRGRVQAVRLHNGRLYTNNLLKLTTRRHPVNNTCFDGISRHFGTSQQLQSPKRTKLQLEEEIETDWKNTQERVLKQLKISYKFKDFVDLNLEDPEHFKIMFTKLKHYGLTKSETNKRLSVFLLTEEYLDHYSKRLRELQEAGFSPKLNLWLFKPLKTLSHMPDIEKPFGIIEKLRNKYGMSTECIQDFAKGDFQKLLQKVEILHSGVFPEQMDYGDYGFLLSLPVFSLQELSKVLQESELTEYRVTDIQKLLAENNYGIENIALLSEFTGISVSEIRQLTKHFNHCYIPITETSLKEKIAMLKTYNLSNEEICRVCCFLDLPSNQLSKFVTQYMELKESGIAPWSLYAFLSHPCVQKYKDIRTITKFKKHITEFQSKFGETDTICGQTLISLLLEIPSEFIRTMNKIEVLNRILPINDIVTPKGLNFVSKLTIEGLIQGVQRSESLSEISIDQLEKSFFYKNMARTKVEQRKTICVMLNISYREAKRVGEIFPLEHVNLQENLTLLQNHGFSMKDIRKLFLILFANTDQLKHQLDVLSSRPEIQASNVEITSFRALNYAQYYLEHDSKNDQDYDPVGIIHFDDDDENEDEKEVENDYEKEFGF